MATVEAALAQTLRKMRRDREYSQTDVAQVIGTSQVNIAHWENNQRKVSPTTLYNLSCVYNSTPAQIYELASEHIEDLNDIKTRAKQLEKKINKKRDKTYGNSNKSKKEK